VRFYIDARNRYAGIYDRPVPLQDLLDLRPRVSMPAPALAPEVSASSEAMELSAPPPLVALREETASDAYTPEAQAEAQDEITLEPVGSEPEALATEADSADFGAEFVAALDESNAAETVLTPSPCIAIEAASLEPAQVVFEPSAVVHVAVEAAVDSAPVEAAPTEAEVVARAHEDSAPAQAEVDAHDVVFAHDPLFPNADTEWRTWMHDLEAARGPKPLAVVERMFVTSYVPLCDALARGIAAPEAKKTLDTWSSSFEQSYKEAFDALRVRGKRPTMVLDVPDLALRMGRLHGARSVQLVLVDGLRFDLGLRVEQRLRALLGQSAALTERLLLWSALPATTAVQLELIGRGAEALREFTGNVDSEVPVARGRMATTLRRIKAGHRELLKLDVVESRVSEPDGEEITRLDELADETARALGSYMKRLPARTLVMVFGDHGFCLDPRGGGTTRARHGGASPEEVLVPAFAWLVGGVH
jgi:hypothetical protein